jgi:hypothetical protein
MKIPAELPRQTKYSQPAILTVLFFFSVFGFGPFAYGQNPGSVDKATAIDQVSGKYEGTAKGPAVESRLTLEIKAEQGKVTGHLLTPEGDLAITEGTFNNGKLVLKLSGNNTENTLTAMLLDEKLTGEFASGGQIRPIELKKLATAPNAAQIVAATAPADVLTGAWDGVAEVEGQPFPFVLALKVEGDRVTGESSSSLGAAPISNGSFKDGKLVLQIDSQGGTIHMNAVWHDGGLVGDFDYAGQAQGKWVAKKKNP